MSVIGYEFLRESLQLGAFPQTRPASIRSVTRIEESDTGLAVPRSVAPQNTAPLSHVLFALKHEGTNLQILAEALPRISAADMIAAVDTAPTGGYIRLACYLWEQFTGQVLTPNSQVGGPYHPVFDPERYLTGPITRSAKWRISFNGIGSIRYCITVERTPGIKAAIASDVLGRTKAFIESLGAGVMDRALAWAYLHETDSSFAIEREAPSEDKARTFVDLLHQAHEPRELSEDYLVELQNAVITNPYDKAASFRHEQNWLSGPGRGALGVTYIPPAPDLTNELMAELIHLASAAVQSIDPIVAASVISFGFVFLHPFMDGNGRLSRFLFHHALCQSGRLEKGLLLPVSVAMKRHEEDYLATLQQYSRPVRQRWNVRWIDEGEFEFTFRGPSSLYRYWDATRCVEFGYRMADQALEIELRTETAYLAAYDHIARAVNEKFDVRGSDLSTLIRCCLDNDGVLSKSRRKQFDGRVPEKIFDFIDEAAKTALASTEAQPDKQRN